MSNLLHNTILVNMDIHPVEEKISHEHTKLEQNPLKHSGIKTSRSFGTDRLKVFPSLVVPAHKMTTLFDNRRLL